MPVNRLDSIPLELAEAALRALFGFNHQGVARDSGPGLERIVPAGFAVRPPSAVDPSGSCQRSPTAG
jgi:hypothetical protein